RFVLDYLTEEVLEHQPEQLRLPARDLGPAAAQRTAVRRGHRPDRQPGPARAGGAGRAVPAAAGRGARLVALPPAVRRPAARPAGTAARPRRTAAPQRGGLVRRT